MKKIKTSAPGKVILFGEHAVVYDKLGIATSVDLNCNIEAIESNGNDVSLEIKNLGLKKSFTKEELFELFDLADRLKREKRFDELKYLQTKEKMNSPFFVIGSLMKKYGFKPVKLISNSEVPKNLGSSSSAFSAIALAVSKILGKDLTKKEISDLAYDGDVIAHGGTPSGIDNSIVTYGGYIQYRRSEGVKALNINFELPIIFVDSGQPSKTGETVPYIRDQRNGNREFVDNVLERLDNTSVQSLDALKGHKLRLFGELMFEYYLELKKLDISTEKLDEIIQVAIKNKTLGAKPTGGWGAV